MDPTEANAAKDQYAAIAKDWDDTVTVFAARIRRSSESAWDGPAAQAARQAISDYATDALNLTPALNALSSRVSEMVNAVLETKKNMPEYSDDPQSPLNPGDWFDGDHEGDLEREAQNLVRTSYTDAARITDKLIPSLPQPRDPVALGDVPPGEWKKGGDGGGDGSGGGGNGGGDTGGGIGGDDNGGGDTGEEVQPGTEEQTEDETTEDSTTDDTTTPSSTDPTSTTPASTVPSSSTPSSTTPASSTSGLPGSGGGFPGAGGSGGSSGSSGLPGSGIPAGRSLAGNPMVTGVPAAAGAGGSGAAGSGAGRSGMPMMGAPGAGRGNGGENESDRKTPDYLVNEENARELLGDEPRTIPGGVLGADVPAARPPDGPPRT
ncbi:hypothetical protein IU453_23985 [Nocardia cyriacigeorgica]|uniref:hypothetical protein n=1 Tax=Nocardia cyriacigeorgica TaxID=135487 RepID=UPI001895E0AD|nr:hypothetical protein [Nocardia cyriacigeorgica]MBF6319818.1 hypothetical protein [Nocardia cyriacigeorgica]